MLDLLFKIAGAVVHRVIQEVRAREEHFETVALGIADDDNIAADDPQSDVHATQIGFSGERGSLKTKED